MSDAVASHDAHAATPGEALFDKAELLEFEDADKAAGRAICKMLSALFIYTLLAMSCAASWTYFAIQSR